MTKINSRRVVADIIHEVIEQRKTLDSVPISIKDFNGLIKSDRGFALSIANFPLRQSGRNDIGITPLFDCPLKATSLKVRALLRVGATQLWILEHPPHSSVYETVEPIRKWAVVERAGGFFNAVLRKINLNRETLCATST